MTFNDVMSKLVTSRPEHSGLRVEFKLNAVRNLVNKGYVIVCPTEVKLKDEKTFLAPYGVIPNYFIILPDSDIDKIIIAELFKSMCRELNNHQQDDLLYDVGERIKVKAYHIEDVNW